METQFSLLQHILTLDTSVGMSETSDCVFNQWLGTSRDAGNRDVSFAGIQCSRFKNYWTLLSKNCDAVTLYAADYNPLLGQKSDDIFAMDTNQLHNQRI